MTTDGKGKTPKWRRQVLKQLRSLVNFENAHFGRIGCSEGDPLPKTEKEVTEFIRRRTQLYRDTWVNPLIDALEKGDCASVRDHLNG